MRPLIPRASLILLGLLLVLVPALFAASGSPAQAQPPTASASDDNPLLTQLRQRQEELNQRAARLDQREQELSRREQAVQIREEALQTGPLPPSADPSPTACEPQPHADPALLPLEPGLRAERLAALVRSVQSMKPEAAAEMLVELPAPLAVELVEALNPRNSARIFDRMPPTEAARLSTLLLGSQQETP